MSGLPPANYTQMPNVLIDEMMRDMSLAELKVMLVAVRLTLGWQKRVDAISLSQFQEYTGLSRQAVLDGIEAAKQRGILAELDERGPRGVKKYAVVFSIDQSTQATSSSQANRPEPVNVVDTQKKGKQKKEKETPRATRAASTSSKKKADGAKTGAKKKTTRPAAELNIVKDAVAAAMGWAWSAMEAEPGRKRAGQVYNVSARLYDAGIRTEAEVDALVREFYERNGYPPRSPYALVNIAEEQAWRADDPDIADEPIAPEEELIPEDERAEVVDIIKQLAERKRAI